MLDHRTSQLTGLLLPLADRHLVLPNVAIAELIDFQRGEPATDIDSVFVATNLVLVSAAFIGLTPRFVS